MALCRLVLVKYLDTFVSTKKKGDYEMFTVYLKVMRNFGMFLTHFLFNSLLF